MLGRVSTALLALLAALPLAAAQGAKPTLGFTAISNPQFEPAAKATFLHSDDMLIGVVSGSSAKAYPAAIVAQHGLVQDQMHDGPIAITW